MTRQGAMLARGAGKPRLGAPVSDQRGRPVGRVADLIGPVREPYILIAPTRGVDAGRLLGQELFTR